MIYITGDCHKDFSRFTEENFPEQKCMTKDDYVIICGDFGGVWWSRDNANCATDIFDLNWLQDRPFTTLFVDGNHENFDELYKYPEKEWSKADMVFRIDHYPWWKEEHPTQDEVDNARRNLDKCNYKVDYAITHDCPTDALAFYLTLLGLSQSGIYNRDDRDILTEFFDELSENLQFSK